jgi:hypothetical protein
MLWKGIVSQVNPKHFETLSIASEKFFLSAQQKGFAETARSQ